MNSELPAHIERVLNDFLEAARSAFGDDLRSAVLYGSAAEGKLRATSDVNLILVLAVFDQVRAGQLREPLRVAQAAARVEAMFLLECEVGPAAEAFPEKFADILHRRKILLGVDPFLQLPIPKEASVARLKQVLLNLRLRLRNLYVVRGLREEQLALVIADAAGPLRSCAATLLELEGQPSNSPKEALERVAGSLPDPVWRDVLAQLSEARQTRRLRAGQAATTVFRLIDLTQVLLTRLAKLP
jgi:predicted nucleotidyltransferase